MNEKKPSIEEIKKRFKAYGTYYNKLHEQQKEIDDYYELVFNAGVPKRYPTRMPSTARDWIDVGVRHFTLDNPKANVFQRNNSDEARKQVEILETFYNFWLRKDIVRIKDAAKKLLLRGEAFIRVNMDATYFGSTDEERLFHFPFFLTIPDPINVYASPAHNGLVPIDVIESFNITVAEAEAMCERNGWDWTTTKAPDKNVKWLSYHDANWRCFLLDDKPVLTPKVQPNLLGFCPYIHMGSGAGQSNYEGKPEYLYRSLIWGKRDMLKMEVRNLSQIDAVNSRFAWVRMKAKGDPELVKKYYSEGVPTDPDKWLYEIPDQLEISILEGQQPPPGLFEQAAMIQGYSNPPAVLGGGRPAGVYSSQHQETLIATAKPMYKDAFKNLEDGLGVSMGMGARILEKVYGSPLEIKNFAADSERKYVRITPKQINGHYDCEVQLLAEPPEANDMRKALGNKLRVSGSISQKTELKLYHDMSEAEAEDEMAQINAEETMRSEVMRAATAKDALSRLGMDRVLEELAKAEAEGNRQQVARKKPPPNIGEGGNTGERMVRQRGRTSPGLEPSTTLQEQRVTRE